MHVHELNPKRTAITLVLFTAVIVIGLLTMTSPRLKYALSPEETLQLVALDEGDFLPYQLANPSGEVLLVDLRNTFEFGRGSIPGAENISAVELLNEENIERLDALKNKGVTVVVFGDTQVDANGPWMVLRMLGYDNVKVLLGGYSYYLQWKDKLEASAEDDSYRLGKPDYNFAEIAAAGKPAGETPSQPKATVTVKRKKKAAVAEGGC